MMKYQTYLIPTSDSGDLSARLYPISGKSTDPVLLFVHGLGGDQVAWEFVIEKLKTNAANFSGALTYDLRGHSDSTRIISSPDYIDVSVRDLHSVIKKRIHMDQPYVLIGHSLGALIVQMYLQTRPSHLPQHVLLISSPNYTKGIKLPDWVTVWLFTLGSRQRIRVRKRAEHELFLGTPDIHLGRLFSDIRTVGLFHFMGLYSTLPRRIIEPDILKELPTTVVTGDNDIFFRVKEIQAFASRINATHFKIVHQGNHCIPTSYADQLAAVIKNSVLSMT